MGLEELELLILNSTGVKDLKLKSNKRLKELYMWNIEINQLDVNDTDVKELDISANLALEILYCYNTNINILDVSQNKNLNRLWCENTPLAYLNIGNNEKLTYLNKTDSTVNLDVVGSSFNIKEAFNGIDPNKMTIISGGELDKETGIMSHYQMGTPIVYKYHCGTSGNGEETMQVTLNLKVGMGDSSITLHKDLNKTYDGQPIEISETDITVKGSTKPVTFIYEEKREDKWVTLESAPNEVGTYRVKIILAADEFYLSAEVVKEFEITEVETAACYEVPPTGNFNFTELNIDTADICRGYSSTILKEKESLKDNRLSFFYMNLLV